MILKTNDYSPFNPRLATAIFFAIFALVFTLFTKYILLSLKQSTILPLISSLLFAVFIGAFLGGLFGETLVKKESWSRSLLVGIVLACLALILASVGIFIHYYLNDAVFFSHLHQWQDYFIIYGAVLLSLTVTVGLWLIPLTALMAIYFNKHFWPGLIAVDKASQSQNKQNP